MANGVTHFEIYCEEPARLADFYRTVFGWQTEKVPGIDYWRIRTGPAGMPGGGGLTYGRSSGPHSWINYINVESVDGAVAQVTRLGGTVLREKTAVPRTGWYALLTDPEGNAFGVWEPDPRAFPPPIQD